MLNPIRRSYYKRALRSNSRERRLKSVGILPQFADDGVTQELAKVMEFDSDPVVRWRAALAVGVIGTPYAIELLCWGCQKPEISEACVAALERTPPSPRHNIDGDSITSVCRAMISFAGKRDGSTHLKTLNAQCISWISLIARDEELLQAVCEKLLEFEMSLNDRRLKLLNQARLAIEPNTVTVVHKSMLDAICGDFNAALEGEYHAKDAVVRFLENNPSQLSDFARALKEHPWQSANQSQRFWEVFAKNEPAQLSECGSYAHDMLKKLSQGLNDDTRILSVTFFLESGLPTLLNELASLLGREFPPSPDFLRFQRQREHWQIAHKLCEMGDDRGFSYVIRKLNNRAVAPPGDYENSNYIESCILDLVKAGGIRTRERFVELLKVQVLPVHTENGRPFRGESLDALHVSGSSLDWIRKLEAMSAGN